jgi:hypothetical protein
VNESPSRFATRRAITRALPERTGSETANR